MCSRKEGVKSSDDNTSQVALNGESKIITWIKEAMGLCSGVHKNRNFLKGILFFANEKIKISKFHKFLKQKAYLPLTTGSSF